MIYFDDLKVGDETLFGHYDVTREEVLEFARKYDPQPFHLSDEEAAKTHFGRIAASGWHTTAMTMADDRTRSPGFTMPTRNAGVSTTTANNPAIAATSGACATHTALARRSSSQTTAAASATPNATFEPTANQYTAGATS